VGPIDTLMIPVAVIPFVFQIIMLAAICWNVADRPRTAEQPLRRALTTDGFVFFLVRVRAPCARVHAC
jgi:hypothetical protein